ncbi:MAG TPA: hypothetical protein ACFYEK_09085 [Candidatus Wunengus sp. YC60]|uniref:hypothetical protein n=1 Tax=Candidatus Wunengus sp. YC60 TaxID=3367697 RepID=UPI0040297F3B
MNIITRNKTYQLLAHAPIPVSVAGTVDETELYSYTVIGGMLGKKGGLRIELVFTNYINQTNAKILKVKFGSTVLAELTVTENPITKVIVTITNRNDEASQIYYVETEAQGMITINEDVIYANEDTSTDKIISVSAITSLESAIAVGNDSLTCDIAEDGVDVIAHFPSHGNNYGDFVKIEGANQTEYNGTWEIFGISPNYFHFTLPATASASPATGPITAKRYSRITLEYCDIELLR